MISLNEYIIISSFMRVSLEFHQTSFQRKPWGDPPTSGPAQEPRLSTHRWQQRPAHLPRLRLKLMICNSREGMQYINTICIYIVLLDISIHMYIYIYIYIALLIIVVVNVNHLMALSLGLDFRFPRTLLWSWDDRRHQPWKRPSCSSMPVSDRYSTKRRP